MRTMDNIKSDKLNRSKIFEWIDNYWEGGKRPCPVCGKCRWEFSPIAFQIKAFQLGDKFAVSAPVGLLMPITCLVCGNTHLINVGIADLLETESNYD